jgi:hypothetical protein
MNDEIFVLHNRSMPWGDFGDILLSGMTGRLPRRRGLLQLERTGPFVPPIAITGFDVDGSSHLVVTDHFKTALARSGLSGFRFQPVLKRRIVRLSWEAWDRTASEPRAYPESGEPEDYILARPHDRSLAHQLGTFWEVCLGEHARSDRELTGLRPWDVRTWLVRETWDGVDWFRATGVGYVYVSDAAKRWLEEWASEHVRLEPVMIR